MSMYEYPILAPEIEQDQEYSENQSITIFSK